MAKTSKASEILEARSGIDPSSDAGMQHISEEFRIGQMIYDARKAVGLSQTQLAETVGTTQSVISQLEDAEYEGHSLSMLRRVAAALGSRIEIRFVPEAKRAMGR